MQSKIVAVGAVVPWAKAGVGAVATQSYANVTYGLEGLRLLEQGNNPEQAIDLLIKNDSNKDLRQVGILSANGESFNFTGKNVLVGQVVKKARTTQFRVTFWLVVRSWMRWRKNLRVVMERLL